jgi:hypothetical protein
MLTINTAEIVGNVVLLGTVVEVLEHGEARPSRQTNFVQGALLVLLVPFCYQMNW